MTQITEVTTQQKAATTDSNGFIAQLLDYAPVARQALADDAVLTKLYELGQEYKHLNLDNTMLYLDANISISKGNNAGLILPTANTLGLVLQDNKKQPVSLACINPNDNKPPLITDTSQPCAFIIGDMSRDSQWWAVDSLDYAIELYFHLSLVNAQSITVIVNMINWLFVPVVKHFSEVQTVYVTTTIDKKDKFELLADANVKTIVTTFDMLLELEQGKSYNDLISDATITDMQAVTWGKPEPLANEPSTSIPYPIDAWQGLPKAVVQKIAYYAQVPLAMAGQCVLGAISHMGQRFIDAPIGHNHMPASLYLITEGESGSGKSVAMGLSHYEIKHYEKMQYKDYLERLDDWESDKATLKGSELREFLTNEPKPYNPITMFGDATIEPILDKFVNGEMDNASWTTDEAGQFFGGHTMQGDTAGNALSALTTLWSDGTINRLRSQKSQHASPRSQAYDVRMTLLLMGQRVILEKALTDPLMNGQGFLARSLIACPQSLQGKRVWSDPQRRQQSPYNDPDLIAYWERCKSLLDPLPIKDPQMNPNITSRIKMRWHDAQAEQAYYDGMQAIEDRQASGEALQYLKSYASRMAENASRIASLMAFFEGRQSITTDDIKRAFMLVEYSTAERLRYLDASPTGEQNDSEKLSEWLVSKARCKIPPVLNKSYVSQNAPNAVRGKKLQPLLEGLESMGHIKLESEGRKRLVYINPNLLT